MNPPHFTDTPARGAARPFGQQRRTHLAGGETVIRRPSALIATGILAAVMATVLAVAAVGPAQAKHLKRYPYTLVDPGTFGGPNSFLDGPVLLTSQGAFLDGVADTATRDGDYPHCPPPFGCSDRYIQHAFAWHNGRLSDLGALPGESSDALVRLNSSGVGVGASEDGLIDPFTKMAASVAVMFDHGKVINLGALPGGFESLAQSIDNQGQVAGFSSNGVRDLYACYLFGPEPSCGWPTQVRAVVWRHGVISDLGTLGGLDAVAVAQNQRGEIAGQSYTSDQLSAGTSLPPQAPFLWTNGHMINLGTLGGASGQANGLNGRGEVVGYSDLPGDRIFHPFLWNGRRMIDLTPRSRKGTANWVNEHGDVTGWTCGSLVCKAFLWRHGKLTILPAVGSAAWVNGKSINDRGEVVGDEADANDANDNAFMAVLWANGHAYNLNKLIAPSTEKLTDAQYINDQGNIVANAVLPNGDHRMVLLTRNRTVPLPTTH